jgi:hypothetical protein
MFAMVNVIHINMSLLHENSRKVSNFFPTATTLTVYLQESKDDATHVNDEVNNHVTFFFLKYLFAMK